MKILYVAKAGDTDNADESAIEAALTQLGHEVIRVEEKNARYVMDRSPAVFKCDFALCHKWDDSRYITQIVRDKGIKLCYWFFDLVANHDASLATRCRYRQQWCRQILENCFAGFHTDGDWVAQENNPKLVHLMQGADLRVAGVGNPLPTPVAPLLFFGMIHHGQKRVDFVTELQTKYREKFLVFGNGGPRTRVHGRALADLIASTKIVIAPDGPITDRYMSNRLVLALSFGAFVLHPYCKIAASMYQGGKEVVYYHDRRELHDLIHYYLHHEDERIKIGKAGLKRTLAEHGYVNRLQTLLDVVKDRLAKEAHSGSTKSNQPAPPIPYGITYPVPRRTCHDSGQGSVSSSP